MESPNLLVNPGAELDLSGWTQVGSSQVIRDRGEVLNKKFESRSGAGMFAGGHGSGGDLVGLSQLVNLLDDAQKFDAAQLDSETLKVEIQFYYQNHHRPLLSSDDVQVVVIFQSTTNTTLSEMDSGLLNCPHDPGWYLYNKTVNLPVGTRIIQYRMLFKRNGGDAIDSYIDDNSLRVIE